jgi:hypothetical protein
LMSMSMCIASAMINKATSAAELSKHPPIPMQCDYTPSTDQACFARWAAPPSSAG